MDLDNRGVAVHLVMPDSSLAQETCKVERPHFMEGVYQSSAQITVDHQMTGARKDGNGVVVSFENALTRKVIEICADDFVVENGTLPNYFLHVELAGASVNWE